MRYGTGVICVLCAGALWSLMGLFLRQIDSPSTWAILFWRSVGTVPVLLVFIAIRARGNPLPVIRAVGMPGVLGARVWSRPLQVRFTPFNPPLLPMPYFYSPPHPLSPL